jgi:hypothetical protein
MLVVAEVSCTTFMGFRKVVEITDNSTLESIAYDVQRELIDHMGILNLAGLQRQAEQANFHIHSTSIEQIRNQPSEIVWICTHC